MDFNLIVRMPAAVRRKCRYDLGMKGKARLEVRLDLDLHAAIKHLADETGTSANQLVEGILAWAIPQAHVGVPRIVNEDLGIIQTRPGAMVWFGHPGGKRDDHEGYIVFSLDFRSTRSVRDGYDGLDAEGGPR